MYRKGSLILLQIREECGGPKGCTLDVVTDILGVSAAWYRSFRRTTTKRHVIAAPTANEAARDPNIPLRLDLSLEGSFSLQKDTIITAAADTP